MVCLMILLFCDQMLKRLKNICISNINKLIVRHLNLNSLKDKFDILREQVNGSIDIFMVFETR